MLCCWSTPVRGVAHPASGGLEHVSPQAFSANHMMLLLLVPIITKGTPVSKSRKNRLRGKTAHHWALGAGFKRGCGPQPAVSCKYVVHACACACGRGGLGVSYREEARSRSEPRGQRLPKAGSRSGKCVAGKLERGSKCSLRDCERVEKLKLKLKANLNLNLAGRLNLADCSGSLIPSL